MEGTEEQGHSKALHSAETSLSFAGRFAILAVQLNGSLPLSVSNGKLVMAFCSCVVFLQNGWNIFLVLRAVLLTLNFGKTDVFNLTLIEILVLNSVSVLGWTFTIFCRIYGFFRRKTTLEFWSRNVELISIFATAKVIPGSKVRNFLLCIFEHKLSQFLSRKIQSVFPSQILNQKTHLLIT